MISNRNSGATWRRRALSGNQGDYLKTGDHNKALEYFERAIKIDPKTELIHFYLAYTYRQLNDDEKSSASLAKSKEIGEHNDSMLTMS